MLTNRIHLLLLVALTSSVSLPVTLAQEASCFSSADITGSVLGTFFSTLAAVALGFLIYWFVCRKNPGDKANLRPCDDDIERHAYSNPFFQDDEPDKGGTLDSIENGKTDTSSTKLAIVTDKVPNSNSGAPAKGNKKAKGARNNPFSVFGNNRNQPQRAQDDSCIHQEPERIEVRLRGSDFTGLGFNICGNIRDGIYVRDVLNRGPAGESGKIKAGDRIYNVTVSFEKITIEDALTILSYASPYDVILDVQKTSEQAGPFLPGHQKKGSMDSSTSGSLGTGGERLTHPIYRSQSSDDVSHAGRELSSNSKRSLNAGAPVRLKKDNKSNTLGLQEDIIKEGNSQSALNTETSLPSKQIINTLTSSTDSDIQVVIHSEQAGKYSDITSKGHTPSDKTSELLLTQSCSDAESLTDSAKPFKGTENRPKVDLKIPDKAEDSNATATITSGDLATFVSDVSAAKQYQVNSNESTPSVKVSLSATDTDKNSLDVDSIQLDFPDDISKYSAALNEPEHKLNENASLLKLDRNSNNKTNPFDIGATPYAAKQYKVSGLASVEFQDDFGGDQDVDIQDLPQMPTKQLTELNKHVVNASGNLTDSLNDSLPDFDIFIPNLDLDDLQATLQATMTGGSKELVEDEENKATSLFENSASQPTSNGKEPNNKRRRQPEDPKRNGKVFTDDEINSHWQAIEDHVPSNATFDLVSAESVPASSAISESFVDSLETAVKYIMSPPTITGKIEQEDSASKYNNDTAPLNNTNKKFLPSTGNDNISLDSLENILAQKENVDESGSKANEMNIAPTKRKAPIPTVHLPRIDIKIPSNVDFDTLTPVSKPTEEPQKLPAKDKSMLNAIIQPALDSDLNENIEYFESKMQSVLQKSPKLKSKRSSVPGKRKAPPPPSHQQTAKEYSRNPFVVGLTPMMSQAVNDESSTFKSESVVFIQPNNVTSVQVNAPIESTQGKHSHAYSVITEPTKPGKKMSGKIDGNFGFGYLKTNFFEGLDKAGEDDSHLLSKGNASRFHSIPRTRLPYERNNQSEQADVRRFSSLGDLTKIEEVAAKSSPLERAVSMDLKGAEELPGGKFGDLKVHTDNVESSLLDSSDEVLLSNPIPGESNKEHDLLNTVNKAPELLTDNSHDNNTLQNSHEIFNSHNDTRTPLEPSSDGELSVVHQAGKDIGLLQGLLKKEDSKQKKNLEPMITQAAPVSPSLRVRSTASITIDNSSLTNETKHPILDESNDTRSHMFEDAKALLSSNTFAKRQQSLSSSSLSEDSIDGERDVEESPKRRMVAVDPALKENYTFDSDSDEDDLQYLSKTFTNNFSPSDGKTSDGNHEDSFRVTTTKESSSVTIPIIPPIITSKDVRSPPNSREELEELYSHQQHLISQDGINDDGVLHRGPVRSLSPTKFPRPWVSSSEVMEVPREENGDTHSESTGGDMTSYHYTFNYSPSKSGSNHIPSGDGLNVTTMHVTVSNSNAPSTKNVLNSSESFNNFAAVPQTNISKTVIISNSQLSLPNETKSDNSGPESPPPTLQPPE